MPVDVEALCCNHKFDSDDDGCDDPFLQFCVESGAEAIRVTLYFIFFKKKRKIHR